MSNRNLRIAIILAARAARSRGDHATAAKLFASIGIPYVHEVQVYQ